MLFLACGDGASAYDIDRAQVVIFGGDSPSGTALADTWVWNGADWVQKAPLIAPAGRFFSAMAYDGVNHKELLFGGYGGSVLGDTWMWDGVNWQQIAPQHNPPARYGHTMTYDSRRGQILLFGGVGQSSGFLNDTWVWNGTDWTQVVTTNLPPAGAMSLLVYDTTNRRPTLYDSTAREVWTWNGQNWIQQSPHNSPPSAWYPIFVDDPAHNQLVAFGGNVGSTLLNGTWEWNGIDWLSLSPSQSPPGFWEASSAFNLLTGSAMFFGGASQTFFSNETWEWSQYPLIDSPLKGTSGTTDLGLSPYTIPIISVFDHAMADAQGKYAVYGYDGIAQAFTSEAGACSPRPRCAAKRDGYANATGTAFGVNGHYIGDSSDGGAIKLQYEGHPGFDYYASCQLDKHRNCVLGTGTNVYAVTSGVIHYPNTVAGLCSSSGCASKYHVLQLLPDNAPFLQIDYLHLSTYGGTGATVPITATDPSPLPGCPSTVTLPIPEGTTVGAGCLIAQSGNTSATYVGPHLHFEVQRVLPATGLPSSADCTVNGITMSCVPVDPYGSACGIDPYFSLIQVPALPLWNFTPYLSPNSLCFGTVSVGASDQQQLVFTNVAPNTLTSVAVGVIPPGTADFIETNNCGSSLAPGQSCLFTVTFSPTASGRKSAMLTITGTDNSTGISSMLRLVASLSGIAP